MYATKEGPGVYVVNAERALQTPTREAAVFVTLSKLESGMIELEAMAQELTKRLAPVLGPETPQKVSGDQDALKMVHAPLSARLEGVVEQARRLRVLTNETLQRLEV